MISKTNRIPLSIIECLKWDLGLPNNYEKTIVPEFPDYFRVVGGGNRDEDGVLSWFVGVMSLQFRLWKRRVLLHSPCNSREGLRWIRSRRSGKMRGRSSLTFLHMKMLLIFCQIVMNRISGRLRFCMSCFIFLCQRRLRGIIYCCLESIWGFGPGLREHCFSIRVYFICPLRLEPTLWFWRRVTRGVC